MELEQESKLEPLLFKSRNRNHNFSKVGNGTVKNSYGSTTLPLTLGCAGGAVGSVQGFGRRVDTLSSLLLMLSMK